MTVSPIWVTMPPEHGRVDDHLDVDALAGAPPSAAARRAFWSSVSSTAERTSATSRRFSLAGHRPRTDRRSPADRGPGPRRPPARPGRWSRRLAFRPSRSSTICWRRAAGRCGSVERLRSSSVPSSTRANRNSSSVTSPRSRSDRRNEEQGLGVVRDSLRRLVTSRSPSWGRHGRAPTGRSPSTDLVDVVLDQLHLRGVVEVPSAPRPRRHRSPARRPRP